MTYVLAAYWPFLIVALLMGVAVGWWYRDPRSADDMTTWLEKGVDER